MSKTAFVTGSTGLLGSNLVFALRAQGWHVKALVRSPQKAAQFLAGSDAEIVIGDMADVAAFAPALKGVDGLFHTAAYFREYYGGGTDHWATLKRINVDATLELLTAAQAAGVQKAVHVSSSGVIGRRSDGRPSDENTPPDAESEANLYFKSKIVGDAAIARWRESHTMPVVSVMPGLMIGPRDNAPTAMGKAVFDIMHGKQPAIPPGGFEFVDARDVAAAMLAAYERGRDGERYIISEGYHSMDEFVQQITQSAGVRPPRLRMSVGMAMVAARSMEWMARLTGGEPLLTVAAVRSMVDLGRLDTSKARRELGFQPRSFAQSVADQVRWYRQEPLAVR